MTGNLDMDNNQIYNLPLPTGSRQPITLGFADLKYLHIAGTNSMGGNINMNNKSIIHLRPPTNDTDAASKKLKKYLHIAGTNSMGGNINMNNKSIIHLRPPTNDTDAAN